MASLYLHIPFCRTKCHYCDFVSFAGQEKLFASYAHSLCRELELMAANDPPGTLATLFVGGGTPTVLPAQLLGAILKHCRKLFGFTIGAEVTVEANPGTIDSDCLEMLLRCGVTRLSLGCQSFIPQELVTLGRIHGPEEARVAFTLAREVGFSNLSIDLMYGIPGQNIDNLQYNLNCALELGPDHLSIYQLGVEPDTLFAKLQKQGSLCLPAEGVIAAMDELILSRCTAAGLEQYEISNYARPGAECLHNLNYWYNEPYWAAGAAAVSYRHGVRARRISDPARYIASVQANSFPIVEEERLGTEEAFRETVVIGLRMVAGVERQRLLHRFGIDVDTYYGSTLDRLQEEKLLQCSGGSITLTAKGRCFANQVMAELV
jgi:oxygen-independent coproporphyrinogen-3 oxidase